MRSLPPLATKDRAFGAVLIVGCGIGQAAALAVAAFATRDAFAALHAGGPLTAGTMGELLLAGVVAAACLFLSRREAERLGQSYTIALRRTLYRQIAGLPKSRHEQRRTGALSLRFVGDLSAARLWFGRGLPDVMTAAVVLPGAVAILYALDPHLAIAGLMPLGLALGLMAAAAWHLERRHRQLRRRRANIAIAMIERIAIAPELDLLGRTGKELRALDGQGASLKADAVARRGRTAGLQAILQIGVAVSGLAMLWLASHSGTPPATVAASLAILGLVALPLQDLGASWDRYCAWRVARGMARKLLDEPTLRRKPKSRGTAADVQVHGRVGDEPVRFAAQRGTVAELTGTNARQLARIIAGLDHPDGVTVSFRDAAVRPMVSYIGDTHVGLQGSLRRSVTLGARKRPADAEIVDVLRALGSSDLLGDPRGLDRRIAENGKDLTAGQTLRLDLARAVLGGAGVIVIASSRWRAEPDKTTLLAILTERSPATVILANQDQDATLPDMEKAD